MLMRNLAIALAKQAADDKAGKKKPAQKKLIEEPSLGRMLLGAGAAGPTVLGGLAGAATAPYAGTHAESASRGALRGGAMTFGGLSGAVGGTALAGLGLVGAHMYNPQFKPTRDQIHGTMLGGMGAGALAGGYLGDRAARKSLGKPSWEMTPEEQERAPDNSTASRLVSSGTGVGVAAAIALARALSQDQPQYGGLPRYIAGSDAPAAPKMASVVGDLLSKALLGKPSWGQDGQAKQAGLLTRQLSSPMAIRSLTGPPGGELVEPYVVQTHEPNWLGKLLGKPHPYEVAAVSQTMHQDQPGQQGNRGFADTLVATYPEYFRQLNHGLFRDDTDVEADDPRTLEWRRRMDAGDSQEAEEDPPVERPKEKTAAYLPNMASMTFRNFR